MFTNSGIIAHFGVMRLGKINNHLNHHNTHRMNTNYQTYTSPKVERIELDNQISLTLDSTPPVGPGGETKLISPDYFNNDPFKTNIG